MTDDLRELDALLLRGVRVHAHHGVYDFERTDGQPFVIDATVWLDTSSAADSDDLSHTVHYGDLATELAAAAEGDPVDLIETLAERLAAVVLAHSAVRAVEITVHKPEAPIPVPFDDVAIRILRRRR